MKMFGIFSVILVADLCCNAFGGNAFDVKEYLIKFGYHNPHAFDGSSDLRESLKSFQNTYGLIPSGILDDDTLNLMHTPRCGNKDILNNGYRYIRKWEKNELTYYFHNQTPDLSESQVRSLIQRALKFWSDVTPLHFTEKSNGDIVIAFGYNRHGDNKRQCYTPFDGPNGVLAHAFYPPDGRLHFDDAETFTDKSTSGTNFLWVATHELGHILGLSHDTRNQNAVMFPYYRPYNPRGMHLHPNDIARIQAFYGCIGAGCGTLHPPITSMKECVDQHPVYCNRMKRYCNRKDWANQYCKRTCNICNKAGTTIQPTTAPTTELTKAPTAAPTKAPKITTRRSITTVAATTSTIETPAMTTKSTSDCTDEYPDYCRRNMKFCSTNPSWAESYCKETCHLCTPGECKDIREDCAKYRMRCNLSGFVDYMRQYCRKTCGCH